MQKVDALDTKLDQIFEGNYQNMQSVLLEHIIRSMQFVHKNPGDKHFNHTDQFCAISS